jgi:membrane fusion protein (multidrug efflux system)
MKKRMTIMIIILAIVFGGIIGFNIIKSIMMKRYFASFQAPAVSVSSVQVKSQTWNPKLPAVGNFIAINGVDVGSQAAGNVVALHFDSGQFVNKDDLLLIVDDTTEQATLKFNQSNLILQQLNNKRTEDLFKRGAASSATVDESKAKLQQAAANVEQTEARIAQKHIKAPFSGKLGIRQVNLGQYITPGQTTIVTLQSLDPLYLEFYLPEQLLKKINLNQEITFTVEEYKDYIFKGKVNAINSKVDINTHNVQVQAIVPNCPRDVFGNDKKALLDLQKGKQGNRAIIVCDSQANEKNKVRNFAFIPGMFAAIEVVEPALSKVLVLPTTAISYSLYGNSVYLIQKEEIENPEDKKKSQEVLKVKRIFIETGDQQGNYSVITKGLKPGQLVVGSGELKLEDDTRVVINNQVQLIDVDPSQLGQ